MSNKDLDVRPPASGPTPTPTIAAPETEELSLVEEEERSMVEAAAWTAANRQWAGVWNNWIAPFHACPRCRASLNWRQIEDALERPMISASCCGVNFGAQLTWSVPPLPPSSSLGAATATPAIATTTCGGNRNAFGMGCGLPIACDEVFRCTDCGVPFHRQCAVWHFKASKGGSPTGEPGDDSRINIRGDKP